MDRTPAISLRRRHEARGKIQHKLDVLQNMIDDKSYAQAYWPKSIDQFRQWEEAAFGVEKIGSKSTIENNRDLKARAVELISTLKELCSRKVRRKVRKENSIETCKMLRKVIIDLTNQLTVRTQERDTFREENDHLRVRLNRVKGTRGRVSGESVISNTVVSIKG